jgi:hypothetical protein
MNETMIKTSKLPGVGLFKWEIGIALLIKIMLLTGLWFLIFASPNKPVAKSEIAAHFLTPVSDAPVKPVYSSQSQQESSHDR